MLGKDNHIFCDITNLGGLSVSLRVSQGFNQIGETVDVKNINGAPISIQGVISENIPETKARMQRAFAAFQSGKLVFEDRLYIYCDVKSTPALSPVKNDGRFSLQLYAPYPFWRSTKVETVSFGEIIPSFSFPVNYKDPHYFGIRQGPKTINAYNDGDIPSTYGLTVTSYAESKNFTLTNIITKEFLRLNGTIKVGEIVQTMRDKWNNLIVEKKSTDGKTENINGWVDDDSSLYSLAVGDNLLSVRDASGGQNIFAQLDYSPSYGGAYEV